MKTEQIIETLRDCNDFLCECDDEPIADPESLRLTIDAAIEKLQELEKERDEAREEAEMRRSETRRERLEIVRALFKDETVSTGTFPWEKGSK